MTESTPSQPVDPASSADQPTNEPPTFEPPTPERPTYQSPSYPPPSYQPPSYQPPSYQPPSYQPPSYQPWYVRPADESDTITIPPAAGDGAPAVVGPAAERHPGRTVALVLATALVAGGIGGAAGAAVADRSDGTTTVTSLSGGSSSQPAAVSLPAGTVEAAAAKVVPSVVSVTERASDGSGGEGSGIILSADGVILTNNHVVSEAVNGGSLQVTLPDNTTVEATIIGRDPSSDLAVIKAKGVSGLTPATLGSSSSLVVGQTVVAVGSPLGLSGTVTSGIVSALNRPVTTSDSSSGGGQDPFGLQQRTTQASAVLDAIQTDAAINPGNSGGPLVDLAGRVVGINSAIASLGASAGSSQSGSIGLGFSIPIDQAKRIAQELIDTGKATHPQLGVQVTDATTGSGALVRAVTAGGPADKAGLEVGDVVTSVDGKAVDSADDLIAHVRSAAPGSTVTVTYVRDGQTATVHVTLGETSS